MWEAKILAEDFPSDLDFFGSRLDAAYVERTNGSLMLVFLRIEHLVSFFFFWKTGMGGND